MNQKTYLIAGAALIGTASPLGSILQYRKGKALDNQLGSVRQQLKSEQEISQMDEPGLLCGRVYLEANLKNCGLQANTRPSSLTGSRP